jgi:hypothetical protein
MIISLNIMHYYYHYKYYYYLTAIGLTPGGSNTHLQTNSAQNTDTHNNYKKKIG